MKLRFACGTALVAVLALGAPAWADKVTICHEPNSNNPHTISVNDDALQAHLDHGDSLGTCGGVACPCWTEEDLLVVTAENFFKGCLILQGISALDLQSFDGHQSFYFQLRLDKPFACYSSTGLQEITRDEEEVCELLLRDRCEAIGHPVITVP